MEKAVIYARCASRTITDKLDSIRYQIIRCEEYADKNDMEIVETFEDICISGNNNDKNRKLFKAISFCKKNKISTILTTDIYRISRNIQSLSDVMKDCKENVITIKPINNKDTSTTLNSLTQLSNFFN